MDIPVTFALLLGRQWFHPLGGVPSTLHQKIKFPIGDKVVTIPAHDDLMVAIITSDFPPRGGFQAAMIYEEEMPVSVANSLKKMRFMPGMGLGVNQQGPRTFDIPCEAKRGREGLGYSTNRDVGTSGETKWVAPKKRLEEATKEIERESDMTKWQKTRTAEVNAPIPTPERRIQDLADELAKMKVNEGEMEAKMREAVKRVFEEIMRGKRNEDTKMPHGDDKGRGTIHETKEGTTQEDLDPMTLLGPVLHDNDVVYNCDFMFQNDVFTSKHDAMKSQFAYLCELSEDGTMHSLDHLTSAFTVHNTALHHVNLGTKDEQD
ncbi:hypothetical protein M5689_024624 [Euphorbia peplus]|nr:hypothetical protein M5689_024624 [Euphorbia peplus]